MNNLLRGKKLEYTVVNQLARSLDFLYFLIQEHEDVLLEMWWCIMELQMII